MNALVLSSEEYRMLEGEQGAAVAFAARLITQVARAVGAARLLPVRSAHIDSCLYHGQAGLDFAERLVQLGGHVAVPTTLNVGSLDLLHPERFRGDEATRQGALRLMRAYVALGATPTWTCAPYQISAYRPELGEHVAWAESNAIVFANSVLGARTERNGDFLDACAALTGRVPEYGLHLDEHRQPQILFSLRQISETLRNSDVFFSLLGFVVGKYSGALVPLIDGLSATTSEDQLKALGSAAATSGSVALFHAVGVTPEAPTLQAFYGRNDSPGTHPPRTLEVTEEMLRQAQAALHSAQGTAIDAVCVGTPHFSVAEFEQLIGGLGGGAFRIPFYVSTGRFVLEEVERRGWLEILENAGATVVVDTCTYVTSILPPEARTVMTNSAKWAYYAPPNIGVRAAFGSLGECIQSAYSGEVTRDAGFWN